MTAQVSDIVVYRGTRYSVAGVEGEGLFDPQRHGLQLRMISTACWRGYYCTYRIEGDELQLVEVSAGLDEQDEERAQRGEGPLLFGVRPSYDQQEGCFVYRSLKAPVAFSGGLLLGLGFIEELYVHMGFHPGWKFRTVHELIFQAGHLRQAFDRSSAMQAIRESLQPSDLHPPADAPASELEGWIEETFSLRYRDA